LGFGLAIGSESREKQQKQMACFARSSWSVCRLAAAAGGCCWLLAQNEKRPLQLPAIGRLGRKVTIECAPYLAPLRRWMVAVDVLAENAKSIFRIPFFFFTSYDGTNNNYSCNTTVTSNKTRKVARPHTIPRCFFRKFFAQERIGYIHRP
jgi:hypothetical protein